MAIRRQPVPRLDNRRAEICRTAAQIIREQGYDATSVNDIAHALGITKAGLYHYISSKEALLFEIMSFGMDQIEAEVVAPLAGVRDPEERLRQILIRHDLALVRHLADRVVVMYLGRVMEMGPVKSIFAPPFHPYTEALLAAVPVPDPTRRARHVRLEGETPSPINVPKGCRFAPRCPRKLGAICDTVPPPDRDPG